MTQNTMELLPYEFARVNRMLLQSDKGNLLLAPDAPDWAVAEVSRAAGGNLSVSLWLMKNSMRCSVSSMQASRAPLSR